MTQTAGLLISVRNAAEAQIACEQKIDVLDVKEPNVGSLGRTSPETLQSILAVHALPPLVSCALGELADCDPAEVADYLRESDPGGRLSFAKVGLAAANAISDWRSRWVQLKAALPAACQLVAVAYADNHLCDSPSIDTVLDLAADQRCEMLLIDTYLKNGCNLLDYLTPQELISIRDVTAKQAMGLCLAGSIQRSNLQTIAEIKPDYVAVRGAVCQGKHREAALDTTAIIDFALALGNGHLPQTIDYQ